MESQILISFISAFFGAGILLFLQWSFSEREIRHFWEITDDKESLQHIIYISNNNKHAASIFNLEVVTRNGKVLKRGTTMSLKSANDMKDIFAKVVFLEPYHVYPLWIEVYRKHNGNKNPNGIENNDDIKLLRFESNVCGSGARGVISRLFKNKIRKYEIKKPD
ncbi:MAG: hypothetical protein ABH859_02960 [Pseudomonadota bacterium]